MPSILITSCTFQKEQFIPVVTSVHGPIPPWNVVNSQFSLSERPLLRHIGGAVKFEYLLYTILRSLHSRKLHILGFLASIVWTRSLDIFFLSLSDRGTYHFCNRSFPWRLNNSMNCICGRKLILTSWSLGGDSFNKVIENDLNNEGADECSAL